MLCNGELKSSRRRAVNLEFELRPKEEVLTISFTAGARTLLIGRVRPGAGRMLPGSVKSVKWR